jgi:hypothetical protein
LPANPTALPKGSSSPTTDFKVVSTPAIPELACGFGEFFEAALVIASAITAASSLDIAIIFSRVICVYKYG